MTDNLVNVLLTTAPPYNIILFVIMLDMAELLPIYEEIWYDVNDPRLFNQYKVHFREPQRPKIWSAIQWPPT